MTLSGGLYGPSFVTEHTEKSWNGSLIEIYAVGLRIDKELPLDHLVDSLFRDLYNYEAEYHAED